MNGHAEVQDIGNCEVCAVPTVNKCSKCQKAYFCTTEHENAEVENHMEACKPYRICRDNQQRYYVISTRPIQPGTVILEESPLILAPNRTIPVCLGCLRSMANCRPHQCKRCKWPLCSKKCQNNPNHFAECHYRSRRMDVSVRHLRVAAVSLCIQILRCLYQKEHFPSVWEKINNLESYYSQWKANEEYETQKEAVLETLNSCFGLKAEFTEDEIMKVWCICLSNTQDPPITTPYPTAIYALRSMFEHHCAANCYQAIDSQGVLRIIAGVSISKGQRLNLCYIDPLWTTHSRQRNIEKILFRICKCSRCMDPTEMSSYLSAIKCQRAHCKGLILPRISGTSATYFWFCNICSYPIPQVYAIQLHRRLQDELKYIIEHNWRDLKDYLKKNEKYVPECHSAMVYAKFVLLTRLGGFDRVTIQSIADDDVRDKALYCNALIQLLERVIPAEKKIFGHLYYQYQHAQEELYRRFMHRGDCDLRGLLHFWRRSQDLLKKTIEYFRYESAITTEGRLHIHAIYKLTDIEENIWKLVA